MFFMMSDTQLTAKEVMYLEQIHELEFNLNQAIRNIVRYESLANQSRLSELEKAQQKIDTIIKLLEQERECLDEREAAFEAEVQRFKSLLDNY